MLNRFPGGRGVRRVHTGCDRLHAFSLARDEKPAAITMQDLVPTAPVRAVQSLGKVLDEIVKPMVKTLFQDHGTHPGTVVRDTGGEVAVGC